MMNIQRAIDRNNAVGNVSGNIDIELEINMLQEELDEFANAAREGDRSEMLDGLIDLIFVAVGSLHKMGLNKSFIEGAWEEVCTSNFSKLPFQKNENGKVNKGENFKRPNLETFIRNK